MDSRRWGGRLWHYAKLVALAELALAAIFAAFVLWADSGKAVGTFDNVLIEPSELYAPQKTVFQISGDGGWFGRAHGHRLANLENQLTAVGEISLESVVVLHGDGVDLLVDSVSDERLRNKVDRLRKAGIRFVVCRQTLIGRKIALERVYGLEKADLVPFGVPEIDKYQQMGFAYIRL